MEDSLIVTYDSNYPDVPTLVVTRENKTLNQLQGDEAFATYALLTGGAMIKIKEITDEVVFQLKCIKEHLKFVSQTIDKSVDFDIQVLDSCISQIMEYGYGQNRSN